jgi:hypothetical protein
MKRLVLSIPLLLVAACSSGVAVTAAPSATAAPPAATAASTAAPVATAPANLPPAGVVWFGISVDTTYNEMTGHAESFRAATQLVVLAHLSKSMAGGTSVSFTLDGAVISTVVPSTSAYDLTWLDLFPRLLTAGTHTVAVQDSGANKLASGTVTITP